MSSSNSSSSSFDTYQNEFRSLIRQIEQRLHYCQENDENGNGETNNNEKESSSSSPPISDLLDNCQQLIPQMEVEIRATSDPSTRHDRTDMLQACKLQLVSYKALDIYVQKDNNNNNNNNNDNNNDNAKLWDETTERRYRQETMQLQDQIGRQNRIMDDALRSIRETERVGEEIAAELARNRATLENAQGKVHSVSNMTERAKGLVKSLNKKWWQFW